MNPVTSEAFADELAKIAGIGSLWDRIVSFFSPQTAVAKKQVDSHFSTKDSSKWDQFVKNTGNPTYLKQLAKHKDSDPKLLTHAQSLHNLAKGKPLARITSTSEPGKSYKIIALTGGGLGCQCNSWRFKGSVTPGYECKHIKSFKAGKDKVP